MKLSSLTERIIRIEPNDAPMFKSVEDALADIDFVMDRDGARTVFVCQVVAVVQRANKVRVSKATTKVQRLKATA